MRIDEAAALIRPAVGGPGETWADLGAGTGTFTRALAALLGPEGRVYAVDRDPGAVEALWSLAAHVDGRRADVMPMLADFTQPLALPPLDGALLANALHFVPSAAQGDVLAGIAAFAVSPALAAWLSTLRPHARVRDPDRPGPDGVDRPGPARRT